MINLKTAHEIDLMARAGSLLASVLPPLKEAAQPGVKTIELDRIADRLIRAGGATPGFLGYNGFPRSICVSLNDEAVHGIPGNRKIAEGDLVSLDLGLVLEGFWADVGVTVGVGKITPEAARLLKVTKQALYVGIDKAPPGTAACLPTSSPARLSEKRAPSCSPRETSSSLVQSPFVPPRPPLVKGVVKEPLPNGVYRVELENGALVRAHVADRLSTHFTRLLAGDKVGVELASSDRSRGRIREIWR